MRKFMTVTGVTAAALLWGTGASYAQAVIGPVPSTTPGAPNYALANYANSPLPTLTGSLTGIRLNDPGCGYTAAPLVTIDPPLDPNGVPIVGGVAATASAALGANGTITVALVTGGSGYITTPNVTITLPVGATCNCPANAAAIMGVTTGTGMRKFIDSLPGLNTPNDLGQMLPVAVPDKTAFAGSEYFEIALVEYREQMHKDLPATGTLLRGYVQIYPPGSGTTGIPLMQADGVTPITVLVGTTPTQVYGYTKPSYLGPVISATRNVPTRIKFYNLLPTGTAGNLFLPVDTTLMGAGPFDVNWDPANPAHPPVTPDITGNFTQNRATLHLHGGLTPWISDGTPHQWTIPVGETSPYPVGMSTAYVPDMPVPSQGTMTFYYPNQQSGRLMFYHDHAYGITRLNVYAGEAAGYLLVDPAEETTLGLGAVPQIPLVIQDKTFVWGAPSNTVTLAPATGTYATDPLWTTIAAASQTGDLWLPHVYMPNQNPADIMTGANPLGRWDYGPWFWPPQTLNVLPMPIVSTTPEMFMDTPVINGTAYPHVDVQPQVYRLRILNACNDRMVNLQLYQADPKGYAIDATGAPVAAGTGFGTEVAMVPAIPDPAIPFPPLWLSQVPGMIPEILDSRPGGVPDPRLRGPAFVQIGTEGGGLPAPVVLPNTPVGYEQNKRNIVVLNVSKSTLFLGPAVRADVLVDFTAYAGKTVILYNDSPAPVPAGDPRIDYYTGNGDYSVTGGANNQGGAPSTLPGYGPNTRTIMQFRVAGTPAATPPVGDEVPANLAAISNAVVTAFVNRTETPIIPEPSYPAGTPGYNPVATYSRIQDTSLTTVPPGGAPVSAITLSLGGTGYSATPTVTIDPPPAPGVQATATATVSGGIITGITIVNPGSGYLAPPNVLISDTTGTGAAAKATIGTITYPMLPKAIHELFDTYGRMNSVLGVELPFTSFLIQTTIPYEYIDPATETVPAGMTQIWKITHNGVDSHAIHFHLVNVQVINRVGWDGAIRPPEPNELGWKETVRMNPLEDCIVAATARLPQLPFTVPDSSRALDVIQPTGTSAQFTGINPKDGTPLTVLNAIVSFGWEYVWHCHLLGHEENDMMRPIAVTGVTPSLYFIKPPVLSALLTPAPNGAGWYNATSPKAPVTVALTATPDAGNTPLVPVASITYSAVGATTIAPPVTTPNPTPASTSPMTVNVVNPSTITGPNISAEGVTTISYSAENSGAAPSVANAVVRVQIDLTAPTTTASLAGTLGQNGWYTTAVTVTLAGSDALSGVAMTTYTLDGGAPTKYTAPFTVSADGTHTVTFFSTDVAGNVEVTKSQTIKIDKTAPTLAVPTVTPSTATKTTTLVYQSVTISGGIGAAADATSGLNTTAGAGSYVVTNNRGLPNPAPGTFTLNANGSYSIPGVQFSRQWTGSGALVYSIAVTVRDNAGNATTNTGTFKVQ